MNRRFLKILCVLLCAISLCSCKSNQEITDGEIFDKQKITDSEIFDKLNGYWVKIQKTSTWYVMKFDENIINNFVYASEATPEGIITDCNINPDGSIEITAFYSYIDYIEPSEPEKGGPLISYSVDYTISSNDDFNSHMNISCKGENSDYMYLTDSMESLLSTLSELRKTRW